MYKKSKSPIYHDAILTLLLFLFLVLTNCSKEGPIDNGDNDTTDIPDTVIVIPPDTIPVGTWYGAPGKILLCVNHEPANKTAIYSMNLDGTDLTKLIDTSDRILPDKPIDPNYWKYFTPMWSPDGEKVAFRAQSSAYNREYLVIMDKNGNNREIVFETYEFENIRWNPDGNRLLVNAQLNSISTELVELNITTKSSRTIAFPNNFYHNSELISFSRNTEQWSGEGSSILVLGFYKNRPYYTNMTIICELNFEYGSVNIFYESDFLGAVYEFQIAPKTNKYFYRKYYDATDTHSLNIRDFIENTESEYAFEKPFFFLGLSNNEEIISTRIYENPKSEPNPLYWYPYLLEPYVNGRLTKISDLERVEWVNVFIE